MLTIQQYSSFSSSLGYRRRLPQFPIASSSTTALIDEIETQKNDTTNSSDTTQAPTATTPAVSPSVPPQAAPTATSTPTPLPSFQPTKKYEPDDDEKKEEEEEEKKKKKNKGPSISMIFLWTIVTFALLWLSCYFSDTISFFCGNVSLV